MIETPSDQVWWKNGFVWMVIAGPVIVIIAALFTYYLAVSRPNEIVDETSYRPNRQSDQSIEQQRKESREAPAMLGRNHATTGIVPPPKLPPSQ